PLHRAHEGAARDRRLPRRSDAGSPPPPSERYCLRAPKVGQVLVDSERGPCRPTARDDKLPRPQGHRRAAPLANCQAQLAPPSAPPRRQKSRPAAQRCPPNPPNPLLSATSATAP